MLPIMKGLKLHTICFKVSGGEHMKVEILIYAYLLICLSMIIFNIACIQVFHHRNKKLSKRSHKFNECVTEQIYKSSVSEEHLKYIYHKLCRVSSLMAFDETLEGLNTSKGDKIKVYIEAISPVFIFLTFKYLKKNKLKAAYFPYIIKKYGIFQGNSINVITNAMLRLVKDESIYCRENALQALYSIGDADSVIKALKILDNSTCYHNQKLIADGLLTFSGDSTCLFKQLWQSFDEFSVTMQVAILDYFRFKSGEHCAQILQLLSDKERNSEIIYSCIRYFGKYKYEPAYPVLIEFIEQESIEGWEYAAIASTALSNYPGEKTVELLKSKLYSGNWYVRFNASKSLESFGLNYTELIDIFEGDDRYAEEMLRYRLDQRRLYEKEECV